MACKPELFVWPGVEKFLLQLPGMKRKTLEKNGKPSHLSTADGHSWSCSWGFSWVPDPGDTVMLTWPLLSPKFWHTR